MKCEKCGKEITYIITSKFSYDGDDTVSIDAVIMETDRNWTGKEEMREHIANNFRSKAKKYRFMMWCVLSVLRETTQPRKAVRGDG